MIITNLIGGIGNQMFQYAVARAISIRNGVQLKLDLSEFENYTLREYKLHVFNIDENIASLEDVEYFKPKRRILKKWLPNQIKQKVYPFHRKPLISERYYHYDPAILKVRDNAYLTGYWQSEGYFKDVEDIIRRDFTLKEVLDEKNEKIKEEIGFLNSVSLHIRRGDYVANAKTNKTHGVLPLNYYYNAMEYIDKTISNPTYYVFSDDMPWVENNLRISNPVEYISHNGDSADHLDLELMRNCKHHIIANSSFSWWGAWLSRYGDKVVIATKKWFANQQVDEDSRYPEGWVLL